MTYLSDIEIAQRAKPEHILKIAQRAHIDEKYIEQYGINKAKIDLSFLDEAQKEQGKLVLVTAITPTPAGEGKKCFIDNRSYPSHSRLDSRRYGRRWYPKHCLWYGPCHRT